MDGSNNVHIFVGSYVVASRKEIENSITVDVVDSRQNSS